ncbi:hypothetical protein T492DRAFT_836128 [Pavlovales sp. CCMP2436]|nr:hypothetical protein T492DRAFT_836128 [Pavlovales sp. CCMP2436]
MAQLLAGYLPPSLATSAPAVTLTTPPPPSSSPILPCADWVALVQYSPFAVVSGELFVGAALLLAAFKNGGDISSVAFWWYLLAQTLSIWLAVPLVQRAKVGDDPDLYYI